MPVSRRCGRTSSSGGDWPRRQRARQSGHCGIGARGHLASLSSTIEEYVQANASGEEAASLRTFDDKPLVVLTAGVGNDAKHSAAQNHLATLSTKVAHRTIKVAAHEDLVADERGAAATTQAILDVLQATRSHALLRQ